MKLFTFFVIFFCLAFPGFSQTSRSQRIRTLSDSMGTTITRSSSTLANFDRLSVEDEQNKIYTSYKRKHDSLSGALHDSELRLNALFRTNDRTENIKEERDIYEKFIKELQTVKADYDNWLRTVQ